MEPARSSPIPHTVAYSDARELVDKLDEIGAGTTAVSRAIVPAGTKPVFVFSGMGPQWWGMGRELLTSGGVFSRTADEIDSVFTEIAGWSIVDELSKPEQTSRIHRTEFAQPANFLLQVESGRRARRSGCRTGGDRRAQRR